MARLRVEKLQEALKQEISKIVLTEIKDPRIKFVSVTAVELTDDLSQAKIYVSLYGGDDTKKEAWMALKKALGFIRSEIAKRIRLRVAPSLVLCEDKSLEYSAHIQELLTKIKTGEETKDE
ncbi:MAG: 30S ribosome-binding factor RbfA [Acholeplasmataceae bacterium]|jgi:ribosome-binding factor A|nr:30S ribosome-binding factor RbfA [Acholeplasmataceae bacterium]